MTEDKRLTPDRISAMSRSEAERVRGEVMRDLHRATGDHERRLGRALLCLDHHLGSLPSVEEQARNVSAWLRGEPDDAQRERNARAWDDLHRHERRTNPFREGKRG